MSYLGGGGDDMAESWAACAADVWISQQTVPHCKITTTNNNKQRTEM